MAGQAKISRVRGSQVTVEHDDGTPETSHQVYAGATVSLNGRPAMLSDLKRYDLVSMLGNPVTVIAAFRPDAPAVSQPPPAPPGALLNEAKDDELMQELQRRGLVNTVQPTRPLPPEGAKEEDATTRPESPQTVPTDTNQPRDDEVPATEGQRTVPEDETGGTTGEEQGRPSEKGFTEGQRVRFSTGDDIKEGSIVQDKPGNKTVMVKADDREQPHRVAREDVEPV